MALTSTTGDVVNQTLEQSSPHLDHSLSPSSRMHRCLEIPELVAEICFHCDSPSLAALGCTARLLDCALDVLWSGYHQGAVEILVSCLIECFPIITYLEQDELSLSAPLQPPHWERFNFYARRVKNCLLDSYSIDPSLLAVLTSFAPPRGLLPNLISLRLHGGDELINARGFLSPTLQRLEIECKSSGYSFASLLLVLPTICPNITQLGLQIPGPVSRHVTPALLGKYSLLRKLDLQNLSAEHLPLVMTLPKLSHLLLYGIVDNKFILPSVSMGACDTLTHVDLAASPKHILALFRSLCMCPLEEISVRIQNLVDRTQFSEIVRLVTEKCKTLSLRRVDIDEFTANPVGIVGAQLIPFLHFPNITHFHCHVSAPLCLDDHFISSLAQSWSSLVALDVKTSSGQFPILTAQSLASLAFHCPKLCSITLGFDTTTIGLVTSVDVSKHHDNKPSTLPIRDVRNRSVHTFQAGYSPIGEPAPVAEYLGSLFPNLDHVSWSVPDDMEHDAKGMYRARWQSVRSRVRNRK